jgi:hypothetical protein
MTERPMLSNIMCREILPQSCTCSFGLHRPYTLVHRSPLIFRGRGALGTRGRADTESIAELAVDSLEVLHAASTGGPPPLGLLAPVDYFSLMYVLVTSSDVLWQRTLAHLSSRIAA